MADAVTQFLTQRGIEVVPHPAYSPDFALNNFYLYPTLKRMLKGCYFSNLQAVHMEVYTHLQCLSKDGFVHVFKAGPHLYANVMQMRTRYYVEMREMFIVHM